MNCCPRSVTGLPLASLEQGSEELVDPQELGPHRGICSGSSSSIRKSQHYVGDVMVTLTLGAFPGCGQLCSTTEIKKDKNLNVVSALFSPCKCRIPVFQHEFHTGRTSLRCWGNIPCCSLVCNGRFSYAFIVGFIFLFPFGLTLPVTAGTDTCFMAVAQGLERSQLPYTDLDVRGNRCVKFVMEPLKTDIPAVTLLLFKHKQYDCFKIVFS